MPELPEVEAVVRNLRRSAIGAKIKGVNVFRARAIHPQSPEQVEAAIGYIIGSIERRGKNIVIWLGKGKPRLLAIRVHLGMTGNLYVIPDARLYTSSVRVLFTLADNRGIVLEDQ